MIRADSPCPHTCHGGARTTHKMLSPACGPNPRADPRAKLPIPIASQWQLSVAAPEALGGLGTPYRQICCARPERVTNGPVSDCRVG